MYVSQGEMTISGGNSAYNWSCEDPGLTSWSDHLVGVPAYPHKILSAKLLTPRDGVSFILAGLTNISHQLNSRSLIVPCFAVFLCDETG